MANVGRALALLIMLYILQGAVVAFSLQGVLLALNKQLHLESLWIMGLAAYPFSLKLLWSPFVDAYGFRPLGLRKTWIVSAQCVMTLILFLLGRQLDAWRNVPEVPVAHLSGFVSLLMLSAATQDVAVDGWALELLTGRARPYASLAQTVGLAVGSFFSTSGLLALTTPDFCEKHLGVTCVKGATVGGYVHFWAVAVAVMTVVVLVWPEEPQAAGGHPSAASVFREIVEVARRPHMYSLLAFLLLHRIPLGAESATFKVLAERGQSLDDVALASLLDVPLEALAAYAAARMISAGAARGRHPLDIIRTCVGLRIGLLAVSALFAAFYPLASSSLSFWTYFALRTCLTLVRAAAFVAGGAFFAHIADPAIGATFMTLLQATSNFGGTWPGTAALWLIGVIGGERGYFIVVGLSVLFGFLVTIPYMTRVAARLTRASRSEWTKYHGR